MIANIATLKQEIETRIAYEVADKNIPSISYTLVGRDGPIALGHVQRTDLEHSFSDQTTFRIASQTKMFTSICLMQLVERGLVNLDVPVSSYLPEFSPQNPFQSNSKGQRGADVTLRKLLSHTSGLIREPKSGHYLDDSFPPLSQTVEEVGHSILKIDPSLGVFSYSNAGFGVVGSVVERVSGQIFADYLADHVLGPLGMKDSAILSNARNLSNLAPAFMWSLEGDTPAPVFNVGGMPAGNIYATLPDMERFITALLRGGFTSEGMSVVSPSSLSEMWQVIGERPAGYAGLKGYGLGFGVSRFDGWLSVGHGGGVYGYSSQLSVLPQAGLGIVMISTLDINNDVVNRLTEASLRLALAAMNMGDRPVPRQVYKLLTREQLANFPGRYKCSMNNEFVEVVAKHGKLYLIGDGMPLRIKPVSGNEFSIDGRLYGEGSDFKYLDLSFLDLNEMQWKGQKWVKTDSVDETEPPSEIAALLGEYGPDFNITTLSYANGALHCLIEYFFQHRCEPLGVGRFKMQGIMYPDETLEVVVSDEAGRTGIRVGPMFLERRKSSSI
jgi:CubicO group peptidase (beta-lactamase class C family)